MGRSYQASEEGVKKLQEAFEQSGWTQDVLARRVGCSRQTVNKFFLGRPVEKWLFQGMCLELNLEYGDVVNLNLPRDRSTETNGINVPEVIYETLTEQESHSTVAVIPRLDNIGSDSTPKTRITFLINDDEFVIIIPGNIDSFIRNTENQDRLLELVKTSSQDETARIKSIERGSIKITFSLSPDGIKRLNDLIKSGELQDRLEEEQNKIHLVQEIKTLGAKDKDLSDTDLSNVDLRCADLRGADLSCADLRNANLENANLENADLNCADLSSTNLSNANLKGVSLHDAIIDEKTKIDDKWHEVWKILNQETFGANLIRANLSSADLRGANLSRANLSSADLRAADLRDADLFGADLFGADLRGANLSRANLSGARLVIANLLGTDLRGANLGSANLGSANLGSANLSGANLSGANLSRANLSSAYLLGANLSSANLSSANLSSANLSSARMGTARMGTTRLVIANLINANLIDANLIDANLIDANLLGVDLSGAIVTGALFGRATGITEDMKQDLEKRGAIFGDRPRIFAR